MSKKNNDPDYSEYLNFFNEDIPLEEDNDDDDYNMIEDILINKYNINEEEPYSLAIPKKEVNDIMNDAIKTDNLFNNNNNEGDNFQINYAKMFRNNYNTNNSNLFDLQGLTTKNGNDCVKTQNEVNKINCGKCEKRKHFRKPRKINRNTQNEKNFTQTNSQTKITNVTTPEKLEEKKVSTFSNIKRDITHESTMKNLAEYISEENKAINQMDIFEKLIFLLKQYDFVIQLLIQNLMLSESKSLKFRCYNMLFGFYMARQKVIENFKFPQFPIKFNFNQIFTDNKEMLLRLQLSFFQPPILEILPILTQFVSKKCFTKEETIKILKEFFPFTNPLYLPITNKFRHCNTNPITQSALKKIETLTMENNNVENTTTIDNFLKKKIRRKFDSISDNLLLIGLKYHGKKNIDAIQQLWLPSRSIEEIKHRIKNLTCQSAPDNIIKRHKKLNETMLNKEEFNLFLKGIEWFGCKNRWNVISRYFLPERSCEYLEEFFIVLLENKILPPALEPNNIAINSQGNNTKYSNMYFDGKKNIKRNIEIKEEILNEYKNSFQDKINSLYKEITNVQNKNYFYTPEETYEQFDIPSKLKKDILDNHITTRNKTNLLNSKETPPNPSGTTTISNMNNQMSSHKNKNIGFDFQIENGEDGTFEKITI